MQPGKGMAELLVSVVADGDDEIIVVKDIVEALGAVAFDAGPWRWAAATARG